MPIEFIDSDNSKTIQDEKVMEVLTKLKHGYPAVYLVGYDTIRGLKIYLNEDVLIPRTETIEFLYDYLKNNFDLNNKTVLDLCTGSGVIALSVKNLYPEAKVTASDISIKALNLAMKSSLENKKEITFIQSDFLKDISASFDIIISNPPYIEEDSQDVDAPFEPELALFSGKDGCDSYRSIFKELENHLHKEGYAFFELEATNAKKVQDLFLSMYPKGYKTKLIQDMEKKDRYLEIYRE